MPYAVKPIPFKPHRLDGLSDRLLESHYENNYGGAVRRLNAIEEHLAALDWPSAPVFEINGLKREELIAANSMLLHEVYFDALGDSGGNPSGSLAAALERDFGSLAAWREEFVALGKALAGGSGWILLVWSPRRGRLLNIWAADHAHLLADARPILALDMYEHAYHLDFGADAGAYVEAFMRNLDWERIAARFAAIVDPGAAETKTDPPHQISVAALRAAQEDPDRAPLVLDVRLTDDLERSGRQLPGTAWRDMEAVESWAEELPRDRQIVVYCMYGFWVSQDTAAALRARGHDVLSLEGGILAWRAMGHPTKPIESDREERS